MRIGAAGINAALEAGVDSIEHGSFLHARSLELFIAKGAFHVPTIIAGVTVLEMAQEDGLLTKAQIEKAMIVGVKIKEALARSHKAGVMIAFGTDMGVGPHGQNAREFGFMVEAGMRSLMLAAIAATWASVWVRAFFAYGISRSIAQRSTLSAGHGL